MPLIPLDEIHEPPELARRRAPTPEQDAAMIAAIEAQGQLTPILVRQNGNGVVLVAGSRRLRALRALGRDAVEAHVLTIRPDQALAAAAAENMVRADLAPVEQWRIIADLLQQGCTLNHAAACLGLSERQAKRLAKLGDLHPDMLALIERFGLPDAEELAVIAAAPRDVQAKAAKAASKHVGVVDAGDGVDWYHVTNACDITRISRAHAIFDIDVEQVVFDEDLFAQPGDPDAVTTTDVQGFVAAQARALRERIAAEQAAKKRVQLAATDKHGRIRLPSGWCETYGSIDKPKKTETVFLCVADAGYRLGQIVGVTAVKDKADAKDADTAGDDADAATETTAQPRPERQPSPSEPADTEPRDPISAAGRAAIAEAKTRALREHLTSGAAPSSLNQLLMLMILALGARTVRVSNGTGYGETDMRDLAARLVSADGTNLHFEDLFATAFEALSRIMHVPGPKDAPDPAVEWIGHFTRAADALPRFDTEEFLAHVAGAELKRLAAEAGMKPAKTTAALREQLAGKLPDWRPATFGAPGPKPHEE